MTDKPVQELAELCFSRFVIEAFKLDERSVAPRYWGKGRKVIPLEIAEIMHK